MHRDLLLQLSVYMRLRATLNVKTSAYLREKQVNLSSSLMKAPEDSVVRSTVITLIVTCYGIAPMIGRS
jgi:hypothetical protein